VLTAPLPSPPHAPLSPYTTLFRSQHSQVQLYMEGPFDKTITFVTEAERAEDMVIPSIYPDISELGYLGGHTLGELLKVEKEATRSEEHTSELQSRENLVCRLLLEK